MALRYLLPGQMRFMKENGFDVIMISADGEGREEVIQNEQCRHIIVPLTRKITPLQDIKCLYQLVKIFKKEKPDIVHTHTPKAGLLGMMASYICGVKIRIHTVAGLPLMVAKGKKLILLKNIETLTYAAATEVWPNSNSLKKYIISQKLAPESKTKMILNGSTNGIDLSRYNPQDLDENIMDKIKKTIDFSPHNKYLLCIGRLVFDKGIVELVRAFKTLQNEHQSLKLILVGDFEAALDPLPPAILSEIAANDSILHIRWTQYVAYYMSLAHLFVFPSHREGFPNVLLQAGAMNLPVICSNITGNTDIISHGKTGLIFPVHEPGPMTNNINFALQNSDIMKEMAKQLHIEVISSYRREDVWNAILENYNQLLQSKN